MTFLVINSEFTIPLFPLKRYISPNISENLLFLPTLVNFPLI